MLQQTQVNTVIPYYEKFVSNFPSLSALSNATEQDVLAIWQGLGYYRRAKNLHRLSQSVSELPQTASELQTLPGIGKYTAGAIASIAFGEKVACVDGNVARVYSRLTCDGSTDRTLKQNAKRKIEISFANSRFAPGEINEALMELGAMICRPADPSCNLCPLSAQCKAFKSNSVSEFPTRKPNSTTSSLTHVCVVPFRNGMVGIRLIPEGNWWGGLWEFPRIQKEKSQTIEHCIRELGFSNAVPFLQHKHTVTRYKITLKVFTVDSIPKSLKKVPIEQLVEIPMPSPQRHIAKQLLSRFST